MIPPIDELREIPLPPGLAGLPPEAIRVEARVDDSDPDVYAFELTFTADESR